MLVANRGEIALRVVRACRELGIRSVAVYSDADAPAAHVRHADDAVHIGKSSASKSYLNADAVLEAARSAGVDAVHPGYGFLSERPSFAAAVRGGGADVRRPAVVGDRDDGRQGGGAGGGPRGGRARGAGQRRGRDRPTTPSPRPRRSATRCWSRPRPAAGGGASGRPRRRTSCGPSWSRPSARRRRRSAPDAVYLERALQRPAPRRGAGARRHPRRRRALLRAGVLAAAAPAEDPGGGAGAGAVLRAAVGAVRRGRAAALARSATSARARWSSSSRRRTSSSSSR